jgi:hypothetical protein
MKTTALLLQTSVLTIALASWATSEPLSMWATEAGDNRQAAAGYKIAAGIESYLIYLAKPEEGAYHHHPFILHHDGVFFAAFSECRSGEDGPGQRVRVTTSVDGKTWSQSTLAVDALDDYSRDWEESGRMSTPIAWMVADGRAWVMSEVTDVIGFAEDAGSREIVSQVRRSGLQRIRDLLGFIATEVNRDGTIGARVWLMDDPPELTDLAPTGQYTGLSDPGFDGPGAALLEGLRENETPVGPAELLNDTRIGDDGHVLGEHTLYRRPDGHWVQLARDLNYSHRLYYSESEDGRHFSTPTRTDIPDSPSKTTSGSLPDGRNFIIGNFVHDTEQDGTRKHYKRYPLVIALSGDGKTFDRAYAIRAAPTEPRFEVGGSSDGYQYPDAIVVRDDLWVIYSINKQDIAISRLPWKDL